MDIARVMISNTATKLEEITVIRQSRAPSRPSMITTVALQVTRGITTQRTRRNMNARISSMMPRIAEPKITRSLAIKLTMSAAIMGTPPTKISAWERYLAAICRTFSTSAPWASSICAVWALNCFSTSASCPASAAESPWSSRLLRRLSRVASRS